MSDSIFGPIVMDTEPGLAMEQTLQEWFPTYAAFFQRALVASGADIGGQLPEPGSYVHTSDPTHFPEEAPPAVVIVCPGTLGKPVRDAKLWRSDYDLRVVIYVDSTDRQSTDDLAKFYGTVIRTIVLNKPSLGNFAEGTEYLGVQYGTRTAPRDQRTLGSCELRFSVDVRGVAQAFVGPTQPITAVPPDWPTVTSTGVSVTPRPIS